MTEIAEITTWFTQPGWTTAHEIRANMQETRCGLWIGRRIEAFTQASDTQKRCGQCLRRRP